MGKPRRSKASTTDTTKQLGSTFVPLWVRLETASVTLARLPATVQKVNATSSSTQLHETVQFAELDFYWYVNHEFTVTLSFKQGDKVRRAGRIRASFRVELLDLTFLPEEGRTPAAVETPEAIIRLLSWQAFRQFVTQSVAMAGWPPVTIPLFLPAQGRQAPKDAHERTAEPIPFRSPKKSKPTT